MTNWRHKTRVVLAPVAALAITAAAALGGCRDLLGLGSIGEADCVGASCDGGGDAPAVGDGGGADAGDGANSEACGPSVPVGDAAALDVTACPTVADGSCAPQPVDAAALRWVPPRRQPTACTPAQIDQFYDACMGPQATDATCATFKSLPATSACYSCIVSFPKDATYGPLLTTPFSGGQAYVTFNTAGCMAVRDPCNLPCARAALTLGECLAASCLPSCGDLAAFRACVGQSGACGECAAYSEVSYACGETLIEAGSPAAVCMTSQDVLGQLRALAGAMCSGG